jgi:hypothetical protein
MNHPAKAIAESGDMLRFAGARPLFVTRLVPVPLDPIFSSANPD